MIRSFLSSLLLIFMMTLTACGSLMPDRPAEMTQEAAAAIDRPVSKVAMMLPVTGEDEKLGVAMQNAASLAVSDLGDARFELLFIDTASTPAGAVAATEQVKSSGASLVLGPIFADEARAIRPHLGNVPAIAFSTDSSVAAPGNYIMGVLPQDQAQHIAHYATARGAKHTLIIAANDAYGQLMVHTYALAARQLGQTIVGPIWLNPDNANLSTALTTLRASAGAKMFDAVFLPLPPDRSATVIQTVRGFAPGATPLILGTGLWDEIDVSNFPALDGAMYAGPSSAARTRFENAYVRAFGARPPRLASLAYDSVALAVTIAKQQSPLGFSPPALTNPSGFAGINGLFRFRADGTVERSLAIIQLSPAGRTVMAPAALSFAQQ